MEEDRHFMKMAIEQALTAAKRGEVPIGAIIVADGRVLAKSHNLVETLNDPTAHAEMQAITSACNALGGKYLNQCTLYVTVEPCPMCAAALYWAQIGRVVYGAKDPKRGYNVVCDTLLHPKTSVADGVLADECAEIIVEFFKKIRSNI